MPFIDLNADLGEEITDDDALLAVVTSANVACGFHAGTDTTMRRVCEVAAERGVVIGAQVSYADREHFGRRSLDVTSSLLTAQITEQVETLQAHAAAAGTTVRYVKPHGALYNRVVDDTEQAAAVLAGSGDLPVLGLPGGVLLERAAQIGRRVWQEGFPDRGYTATGRLVPRDQPGALIVDEPLVIAGALRLAPTVDSLCLHGDSPGAVAHACAVRRALTEAGWSLSSFERL